MSSSPCPPSLVACLLSLSTALLLACGDEASPAADAGSGQQLAVSCDWLNHTLSVIDVDALTDGATREDALVAEIDLSAYAAGPLSAEIVPGTQLALVSLSSGFFSIPGAGNLLVGSAVPSDTGKLVFVDLKKRKVVSELDTGKHPMGITITPDGKRAFVAHFASPHVAVIDIEDRSLEAQVEVGPYSEEIVLDDSGEVGIFSYSSAGNLRTFGSDDFAGSLSDDVMLAGDAAGVAFFPGTKIAFMVHAPMPITGAVGGHVVVDVNDPKQPVVLEEVDDDDTSYVSYPAASVTARDSVVVPISRSGELELREYKLEDDKAKLMQVVKAGPAMLFGAYSASSLSDGRVLLALPSSRAVVVVDLDKGEAARIDWGTTATAPTDLVPVL